ncbi:S9 family peptidase [candidate division KSB1 bacterium]|nr:S9 family peptidase [candidate division KSB1 bacterium]
MRTAKAIAWLLLLVATVGLHAGEKKPLDHTVYDEWKSIEGHKLSVDGKWVLYGIEPQEGDGRLIVHHLESDRVLEVERGTAGEISRDMRFAVCKIRPFFAETRQAKIDKKKDDEMPPDTLAIVDLETADVTKIPHVKTFKLPEEGRGWLVYTIKSQPEPVDTLKTAEPDSEKTNAKEKKDKKETVLVIRRLADGREFSYPGVESFELSKDGSSVLFAIEKSDSLRTGGVYLFDTAAETDRGLLLGKGKYKMLVWDDAGEQAAFLADRDTSKAKERYFSLCYWKEGTDSARVVADTSSTGIPDRWIVSEHGAVNFSEDGNRLFFRTSPRPVPEDTTIVEFEVAKVDVWNWKDPYLQPQQLKEREQELKRSYTAVMNPKNRRIVQLGSLNIPEIVLADKGEGDIALGRSNLPYRQLRSWKGADYRDVYLVSLKDGSARQVLTKHRGPIAISAQGNYLFGFDEEQGHWFTISTKTAEKNWVSKSIPVNFANELSDHPDLPKAYGHMGWSEGDRDFYLYDRFDIWRVDPAGKKPPVNVTDGFGREEKIRFRAIQLEKKARFFRPDQKVLLEAFAESDKSAGFYTIDLGNPGKPKMLVHEPYSYSKPIKAEEADVLLYTRASFVEFPDLWVGDLELKNVRKISDANPQQADYLWGTAELVKWRSQDGVPLDGILYKPENFDSTKKYPMIVYFYERTSFTLHWYLPPRPSPSTVRPSFYASRGYLFFIPDIVYTDGYPGESAYKCIVPGVMKLIEKGFVDEKRIGIQGQSWGGYQVAYLVTRTNLFAAAMAGAPVSNMISAYGGIRWGTGHSRMFQYEHSQSRIGGTLWEKPWHYIRNSPLFRADDVNTPLLMMHNDNDGAVPWYQGIEMFVALRRLGKPVWLLNYNGEEHNLVKRQNRKDLSIRLQQFFDHYLKDAPQPIWMRDGVPATMKGKTWGFELTE